MYMYMHVCKLSYVLLDVEGLLSSFMLPGRRTAMLRRCIMCHACNKYEYVPLASCRPARAPTTAAAAGTCAHCPLPPIQDHGAGNGSAAAICYACSAA